MSSGSLKYLLYILALLLAQEIIFRICFPLPELSNFDRINYMLLDDSGKRYRHLRDQKWYWQSSPDTNAIFYHNMNRYGFRDTEWPVSKKAGRSRILMIGDSFVEGIMAQQQETIIDGFKQAAGPDKYEVWNGGMMGAGLSSYLQLAADMLPIFQPDHVFLFISANDLSQKPVTIPELHLSPEYFNPWKPRIWEIMEQLSNDSPIRFRWINVAKPYIPSVKAASNPWQKREAQLKGHVTPLLETAMKAGTYSPFRTNNIFNEERIFQLPPNLGDALPFFAYFCEKFGAKPVVIYIPSRNQVSTYYFPFEKELCLQKCLETVDLTTPKYQIHQATLARACQAQQIPFIDLTHTIRNYEQKGTHLYWNYDDHMKAKGYLLMGKTVIEQWKAR